MSKATITIGLPSIVPSIDAENIALEYDDDEGYIAYTITNPVDGGTITASTDAEWLIVDDAAQTTPEGSIYFTCAENSNFYAHSATVTLTYTYSDSKATVTKDVTVTQALWPDANGSTAENPITVSEAIDAIDEVGTVSNIYVGGIVSNIHTAYYNGYITFDMIDEIGNEYFLRAYKCTGDDAAEVAVGDEVVVCGNLFLYNNSIYEFQQNCELVSLTHPVVPTITVTPATVNEDSDEHDGTLALTSENLVITIAYEDFGIQFYDAEEIELNVEDEPDWIDITAAEEQDGSYVVSYYMLENEGEARTAYFKVFAFDADNEPVYSNLVTINQAAPVVPPTPGNWVLTSLADLTEDDIFVIVGTYEDVEHDSYAMSNDKGTSNAPNAVAVTIVDNTLSGEPAANIQWKISGNATDGYTFYPNGNTETWLYCTNTNDGVRVGTNNNKTFVVESGYLKHVFTSRFVGIYNTQDWRCYTSGPNHQNIGNQSFAFYKKVVEPVTESYTLTITAHTANGGWNLIASPVAVNPASVEGMVAESTDPNYSNFDLYYFDETGGTNGKEWKNYKANAFNLVPGKGYLYANANTVGLTFTGEMNNDFEDVDNLPYVAGNTIQSLYLAGNSKTTAETFYVYNEDLVKQTVNFLTLNGTGDGFVTSETNAFTAQALQGFFVQSGGTGWMLSTADMEDGKSGTPELLNIMVNQNRGTLVDNAIVSFSDAPMMNKFYLNDNSTRVYIPQNGEDMAVVRSEAQGELPVNFRASENGTYTLSIDAENVEMNYLHLIDNMTGMDIDLLQTPSYTFEATTRDYESRFRLVFAGASTGSATDETFAFFSNGNLIINNEGIATLQVIDITGRILSSESVNGSVSTTLNATPGVYMLRLINGENVKVQKIVVR